MRELHSQTLSPLILLVLTQFNQQTTEMWLISKKTIVVTSNSTFVACKCFEYGLNLQTCSIW